MFHGGRLSSIRAHTHVRNFRQSVNDHAADAIADPAEAGTAPLKSLLTMRSAAGVHLMLEAF
jgi:hypothetical protein